MQTVQRTINIDSRQHAEAGLILAFSNDLPGLLVSGRDIEEIEDKLEDAIREILEAQGHIVIGITMTKQDGDYPSAFGLPAFIADAALQEATH